MSPCTRVHWCRLHPSSFVGQGARPVSEVAVEEIKPNVFQCAYTAPDEGDYEVDVTFDDEPVRGSPFPVQVARPCDASKCVAQGDGLEKAVIDQLAEFDVDCSKAGKLGGVWLLLAANICHNRPMFTEPLVRRLVIAPLMKSGSKGQLKVEWCSALAGAGHVTTSYCSGVSVPLPTPSVQLTGLEPHPTSPSHSEAGLTKRDVCLLVKSTEDFEINCDLCFQCFVRVPGEGELEAKVTNPSGAETDTLVTDNEDGSYSVSYTPTEEGVHDVDVKYGGKPIPGSPFKARVLPPTDPTRCKAYGPGLERAVVDEPAEFTVETRGAGEGGLSLAIEGPSEAKLNCTDNGDGMSTTRRVAFPVGIR